jgi:hypothetical protein
MLDVTGDRGLQREERPDVVSVAVDFEQKV